MMKKIVWLSLAFTALSGSIAIETPLEVAAMSLMNGKEQEVHSYKETKGLTTSGTGDQKEGSTDSPTPTLEWSGDLVIEAGTNASLLEDVQVTSPGSIGEYSVDVRTGQLNLRKAGTYTIEYVIKYGEGLSKEMMQSREVVVKDTTAPALSLNGDAALILSVGESYQELGATVTDNTDDVIQYRISGDQFSTKIPGTYSVFYAATDNSGNTATISREIHVRDTVSPVIILKGDNYIVLTEGSTYQEAGYMVSDNYDSDVKVIIQGDDFDSRVEGTYTITYTARDGAGNESTISRTVVVKDVPEKLEPEDKQTPENEEENSDIPEGNITVIGKGVSNAEGANVRLGSGTSFDSIGKIAFNEEVEVYAIENGWYKINFRGQVGFIRQDFLEYTKTEAQEKPIEDEVQTTPVPEEPESEKTEEIPEVKDEESEQEGVAKQDSLLTGLKWFIAITTTLAAGTFGVLYYIRQLESDEDEDYDDEDDDGGNPYDIQF